MDEESVLCFHDAFDEFCLSRQVLFVSLHNYTINSTVTTISDGEEMTG